jgi:hypothetical protein
VDVIGRIDDDSLQSMDEFDMHFHIAESGQLPYLLQYGLFSFQILCPFAGGFGASHRVQAYLSV